MSTVLDVFGSEYGWSTDYVLWHLTRHEVEALLGAISRRYQRQAKAMDGAGKSKAGPTPSIDRLKPSDLVSAGIPFKMQS